MFFPHFVGDACSREPHQFGKGRVRRGHRGGILM
jgi:hypothetical protein